jgi:hypothetical protein
VSRVLAIPSGIFGTAFLLAMFASPTPQSGMVIDGQLEHGRRTDHYELAVALRDVPRNVTVDVDRELGERVVTGDSAVVQMTRLTKMPRSVSVYRNGQTIGSDWRAAIMTWAMPIILILASSTTLVRRNLDPETDFTAVAWLGCLNLFGVYWGVGALYFGSSL